MNRNPSVKMRELVDNEVAAVTGGVIGAIPGYTVQLPAGLFVTGHTCIARSFGGEFLGGTCTSTY
jgi:hypothetical protein